MEMSEGSSGDVGRGDIKQKGNRSICGVDEEGKFKMGTIYVVD